MFERFRKKKQEPEVIHHKYDIIPPFDWENATSETATEYFKTLTRIQMLEIYDRDIIPDSYWEQYYERLNEFEAWPTDKEDAVVLNKLYWDSNSIYKQFLQTQKKVEGMQKKLDRITVLLSKAEFKLCGEDALKL
jgi:hypothetical protein